MPNIPFSLQKIVECLRDHPAVSDRQQTLTYRELWQKIQALAAWLHTHGFANGAPILVEARPEIAFAVAAMGIQLAGAVLVPVEKDMSITLLHRLAEKVQSRLFIGESSLRDISCLAFDELLKLSTSVNARQWQLLADDDTAEILYTTGTTGSSKTVLLSHHAVWAAADNNRQTDQLAPDSIYLIATPLNHINALRKFYSCLIAGGHTVLNDGFLDLCGYYDMLERHHANILLLPPSAVRLLLTVSRDKLHSLKAQIKVVHSGSAAMTEVDKEALRQALPDTRLIFGYGATEASNVCAYNYAAFPGMANCVGKPTPHSKISIVDEFHREISSSPEKPGLIAISGDTVMKGYLNDPVKTAEVLQDNILYTNDVGYIDSNGFLFVIGRADDIINCGGLKIAPSEVENIVMQYPGILECACYGGKDAIAGSIVQLAIVVNDTARVDLHSFRSFLLMRLEEWKVPRDIRVVQEIPKTPNGKIDRKKLIEEAGKS